MSLQGKFVWLLSMNVWLVAIFTLLFIHVIGWRGIYVVLAGGLS
jgi:hypothetical protein